MPSDNYFKALSSIDCSKHVEQKGRYSYLSWTYAIQELKKTHPDATWEVCRFDGVPYMKTEFGVFVEVSVTVNGVTHSQIHPVLDNRNSPIEAPTSFQINTSIQRCLVKAIALHGLGLYIYAGEDLPEVDFTEDVNAMADLALKEDSEGLREKWTEIRSAGRADGVWAALPKDAKPTIKEMLK